MADFFERDDRPPAEKAWVALSLALNPQTDSETHILDQHVEDRLPRWPSTIPGLQIASGGLYGVSVIAGSRGLGKTRLALASAVEAAATQQWQVVYFSAELDAFEIGARLGRMFSRYPGTVDCADFLHVIHVGKGQTLDDLRSSIEEATDPGGDPILVVMDSINTIAELIGGPYLLTLSQLGMWAMFSRRMSLGAVSWMLISETNKQGGVKGGKLDYWADCIVRMQRPKEAMAATRHGTPISLILEKSRRTGGEGPLGIFVRDAGERLVQFQQSTYLRVVGDDIL